MINKSNPPDPWKYAASASDEMAIQTAIYMWACLPQNQQLYPDLKYLFHIPNGMFTSKPQAARFKAAGMKKGVLDNFLPVKRGEYSGLWIELKRPKDKDKKAGVTTTEQDEWIAFLQSQSYAVVVCYGFEETIKTLQEYLNYKKEIRRNWATKEQDMKMFDGGWK